LPSAKAARHKLNNLEQRDVEIGRIRRELAKVDGQLFEKGQELTAHRRKLGPKLISGDETPRRPRLQAEHFAVTIHTSLPPAMTTGEATCNLKPVTFNSARLASTLSNLNSHPIRGTGAPLRAVASSGEMARVMLALKTAFAAEDEIPVLVFDEVDANVGGETAHAVGDKMRQIAHQRQVLCITHLAPVAAAAAAHYEVSKERKRAERSRRFGCSIARSASMSWRACSGPQCGCAEACGGITGNQRKPQASVVTQRPRYALSR